MFAFALVLSTIHENALAKAKRETTGNGPIRCWEHNFNLLKIISIISTTNVDKLCFASGARVGTQLRETQLVKDRLGKELKRGEKTFASALDKEQIAAGRSRGARKTLKNSL